MSYAQNLMGLGMPAGLATLISQNSSNSAPAFTGNYFYIDPVNGSDSNAGTIGAPFQTIYMAYAMCVSGHNDVCVLIGNGSSTGTARMSTALAASVTPSATTGTLTWAKNATHLIGICSPVCMNARARFAPPTGTYTAATFGNAGNMFNVTGTGCYFSNFSVFNGFSTGAAAQIAWIENGGRNAYVGVAFQGMNDTASANDAGSMAIQISGSVGENLFQDCFFGDDTTARTAANSTMTFTGGSPRNQFINCKWLAYLTGSGSGAFHVTASTSGIDREAIFDRCKFIVAVKSGSATTMAQVFHLTAPGGMFILDPTCVSAGATAWETSSSGFLYVSGAVPTFATSGVAKPS